MKPARPALSRVLLLLFTLILPAAVGCGSQETPGGPPIAATTTGPATGSPSPTPTPTPSPTPTPTPSTTATRGPTPSRAPAPATPGWTVVSSRVAYQWGFPGDTPVRIPHTYPVPPVAQLVAIGAAHHPKTAGERSYDRVSFTFTTGYPSYTIAYWSPIIVDGDRVIPLGGPGSLYITFTPAQSHTDSGASSIRSAPPEHLKLSWIADYGAGRDHEGYLDCGLGFSEQDTLPAPVSAYSANNHTVSAIFELPREVQAIRIDPGELPCYITGLALSDERLEAVPNGALALDGDKTLFLNFDPQFYVGCPERLPAGTKLAVSYTYYPLQTGADDTVFRSMRRGAVPAWPPAWSCSSTANSS